VDEIKAALKAVFAQGRLFDERKSSHDTIPLKSNKKI
jgi:hypothetical protein